MSEMVGRVTNAISGAFSDIPDPEYRKIIATCWALAAIKAMREPTDAMLGAIHGCAPDAPDRYARPVALKKWQDAIDEALS